MRFGKKRRPPLRAEQARESPDAGFPSPSSSADRHPDTSLIDGLLLLHKADHETALAAVAQDLARRLIPGSESFFILEDRDGLLRVESELVKGVVRSLGKRPEHYPLPHASTPLGQLLTGEAQSVKSDRLSGLLDGLLDRSVCELLETHCEAARAIGYALECKGERLGAAVFGLGRPDAPVEALEGLAKHMALAVHLRRELNLARRVGHVDPVRWVPDEKELRRELSREMGRAKRYGTPLWLLLFAVTNLDDISAQYGRAQAHRLLRGVGSRLSRNVRASDFLAAHGPDGYAVILTSTDHKGAAAAAKKLLGVASRVTAMRGGGPAAACEVGTAAFPEDGETVDALRSAAEARLRGEAAASGPRRTAAA